MEGERFDRFTRGLGQRIPRRGAIGGIAGGMAALLGGVAARDDAAAKKGKKGKKTCDAPKTKCGKKCVDTSADPKHCGDCDTRCASDETCSGGACVGKCGTGKSKFTQDFEKNTSGWHGQIERVKSGTHDIKAHSGKYFAIVPKGNGEEDDDTPFTRWGEYSDTFPNDGYTTELAIYLDPAGGPQTDTRFDYSSAVNQPDCNHRRDFIFSVGVDTDASEPTYCISASNNAPGFPCNPDRNPKRVSATGWYLFRHVFRSDAGVLAVDFVVVDPDGNEIKVGTLSDASDIIGETVGGNRYGWIVLSEFDFLAIDDSKRRWS